MERKAIEIERLKERLNSRLPKGRDPLGDRAQQSLEKAIALPEPAEKFEAWEQELSSRTADLSRQLKTLPYSLLFGSTDDLYWSQEDNNSSSKQPSTSSDQKRYKPKRCRTRKRRKKSAKRIFVRFKGKGLSHFQFGVYCDRRQQPILEQFCTDYTSYKALRQPDKFSIGLFALRSATLLWRKDTQNLCNKNHWRLQNLWLKWFSKINAPQQSPLPEQASEFACPELVLWYKGLFYLTLSKTIPWQTHRLYLHCTYDPRLLTTEGTEQVRQEKITQARKLLKKMRASALENTLDPATDVDGMEEILSPTEEAAKKKVNRQAAIKHLETSLNRLENNLSPP